MFYINLLIYLIGLLLRNIISIPLNFILSVLLIFPSNRSKINIFKQEAMKNGLRKTIDNFYRYNFSYSYFFVLFSIHPIFLIIFQKGDCLNYCNFVKWTAKQINSKSETTIYEIFSKKPFIKKNHAFIIVDNEMYTPYWHTKAGSISYFEKLMNAEYFDKYLNLDVFHIKANDNNNIKD